MPRRPSSARAAATRSPRSPRRRLPRPRLREVRSAGRSASGSGDDDHGRLLEGARPAAESSGSRACESKTTRLGWRAPSGRAGGEQRVVGEDGADADRDRVGFRAPAVDQRAALLAGDPGGVAGRGRGAAVERIAIFSVTSGRPVRACLRKGWFSSRAAVASAPAANSTSTPPSRRIPGPRPEAFSVGSSEAITTRAIPPRGSRRCRAAGALVRAGLERHVHRRPGGVLAARAAVLERRPLGVQAAELGVEALADHLAVAHDDGADQRVGADLPPPILGQLQRALQVGRSVPVAGSHQ